MTSQESKTSDERLPFHVAFTVVKKQEMGTIVGATSEEEAKALVHKLFGDDAEVNILDVFRFDTSPQFSKTVKLLSELNTYGYGLEDVMAEEAEPAGSATITNKKGLN